VGEEQMKLGILDIAGICFIVLKLTGVIGWTWEQVLSLPIILFTIGFVEGVIEFFMKNQEEKE
jgi:ABC-type uncharacterized transport system permease subunit